MKLLQQYFTKLIGFASANSTIVASSSSEILRAVSKVKMINKSSFNIVFELNKVLPSVTKAFIEIAAKLSEHIGELVNSFANATNNFVSVMLEFTKALLNSCHLHGCRRVVDYIPVLKSSQKLMNTLALIGETLLNECECEATEEVYEAVFVLDLLYGYLALTVPGIHSCVTDLAYVRNISLSRSVKTSVLAFQYALIQGVLGFYAVDYPFNKSIKDFLTLFADITTTMNTALADTLEVSDGIGITIKDIAKILKINNKCKTRASQR